jgi:hypothetical protein
VAGRSLIGSLFPEVTKVTINGYRPKSLAG